MLPLGGAGMEHGDAALPVAHQGIRIILDVVLPKTVGDEAFYLNELAAEELHEINEMDPLIEKDAASRVLSVGSPPACEVDDLAFAIDAAHVDDLSQLPGLDQSQGLAHRMMIAVVKSVLEQQAGLGLFNGDDPHHIPHVPAGRLLAKDVHVSRQARYRGIGGQIVRQTDKEYVQGLFDEFLIGCETFDAVGHDACGGEFLVADRDRLELWMTVNEVPSPLADDAVTGDAYF